MVLILVAGCGKSDLPASPTPIPPTETPALLTPIPTRTAASLTETPLLTTVTPVPPTTTPVPRTAAPIPTSEPVLDPPSISAVLGRLEGLPIDEFLEESFRQLQLRDPDILFADGFADVYGVVLGDQFVDMSADYTRETQQLEREILDLLRTCDRSTLSPDQKISYDSLEWYLSIHVRGHAFTGYKFLVNPVWGLQNWPIDFLLEHPLENEQDAESYIARLASLDTWVKQVIEGLEQNEQAGAIPPTYVLEDTIGQLETLLNIQGTNPPDAEQTKVYTSFQRRVQQMDGLGEEQRETLLNTALTEIEQTFIPAYRALRDHLVYLTTVAVENPDQWSLPGGEAYYAYLLEYYTGTDLHADEIHALGLAEVARIQEDIRNVAAVLGYPDDITMAELNQRISEESQIITGHALRRKYEQILTAADQAAEAYFDLRTLADVVIRPERDAPLAYYDAPEPGSLGPGAMPVNLDISPLYVNYNEHVLVHHETIPGHHTQLALAQELDLPRYQRFYSVNPYRQNYDFLAYVEGWAFYAEGLAWEMGLYDDDPFANLGRLRLRLLRTVRMVVDTGIHAKGWTLDEAAAYIRQATGMQQSRTRLTRYLANPGYACSYNVGGLKILEMRQRAMEQLGDAFDIKEFHNIVLGNGIVPIGILEHVVDDWIEANGEISYTPLYEPSGCRFAAPSGYEIECGYLTVPEDRSQPTGPQIRLHTAIFKSTNPDPEPDPVVHLVGGPGGSLLDSVDFYLHAGGDEILKKRDYVLFNQRGTRYADPFLACPGLNGLRWDIAGQGLSLDERNRREAELLLDCQDDLLDQGINLSAYNSAENAADVNDLRVALGYEQINLYGISYGSRLALTVMRDYPEGIRSAIIDAVFPPQANLNQDIPLNARRALHAVFEDCTADTYCSQTYPDLEATFYQVVDELNANPISLQFWEGTVIVDGYAFVEALFRTLYSIDTIPWIPMLIDQAGQGEFPRESIFAVPNMSTMGYGMHYSIWCREEMSFESKEEALALAAGLPPVWGEFFADAYDWAVCASWEAGVADPIENKAVVSDIPTLVLSGRYDPVTPPAWGRLAGQTLANSFFYEFPNLAHGAMRSNSCALEIGLQFLDDPTTEPDTSCLNNLGGPEFK
jgi:uncharacterized protein (DUF885 family)/pimeloyl-ACP methyl ester carboxylesterase